MASRDHVFSVDEDAAALALPNSVKKEEVKTLNKRDGVIAVLNWLVACRSIQYFLGTNSGRIIEETTQLKLEHLILKDASTVDAT